MTGETDDSIPALLLLLTTCCARYVNFAAFQTVLHAAHLIGYWEN
jgi:hypothetical protein